MTETPYCSIDYHTIKDGIDIYLCDTHDMTFYDEKGNKPILCNRCNQHMQMYWVTKNNNVEGYIMCWDCDNIKLNDWIDDNLRA